MNILMKKYESYLFPNIESGHFKWDKLKRKDRQWDIGSSSIYFLCPQKMVLFFCYIHQNESMSILNFRNLLPLHIYYISTIYLQLILTWLTILTIFFSLSLLLLLHILLIVSPELFFGRKEYSIMVFKYRNDIM